jgi:TonB-linked SusC/RagA family outer membrane protein
MRNKCSIRMLFIGIIGLCFAMPINAQKVTLNYTKAKLSQVLTAINRQSGKEIVYSDQVLNVNKPVTIKVKNMDYREALNRVLKGSNVKIEQNGDRVYIMSGNSNQQRQQTASALSSQTKTVSGRVTDSNGEPIIGATVIGRGGKNGVSTDIDGKFSVTVPENETLQISSIGYEDKFVQANDKSYFNITLKENAKELNEIVVVGYTTSSKHDISGAVEKLNSKDMNQGVVMNPADAMKGKISGVYIGQEGGSPSATPDIRIRGISSLSGGSSPLVIIDGIFSDVSVMRDLSPNDIESVSILKDASETAQYGSRGAAGVIVITTKKGKSGRQSIEYLGQIGINSVFKNLDMLKADQYRSNCKSLGLTFEDLGENTDWLKTVERNSGLTTSHNLAFSSGSDMSNMRIALGTSKRDGVVRNTDLTNYTVKFDGTQYAFDKKVKFELGFLGSQRKVNDLYNYYDFFFSASAFNPTYPSYRVNGAWKENYTSNYLHNPSGELEITNNYENTSMLTHAKVTWTIINGLDFSAFGSYTYLNNDHKYYVPNDILAGKADNGRAYIYNGKDKNYMGNLQLSYVKDFGKSHINALILFEGQNYKSFWNSETAKGFETNYFKYNNLEAGANVSWGDNLSYNEKYTIISYMARLNYIWDNKYIATANFRRDGSSKLGSGNKWGTFPSASLAWVMSNENFLKGYKWINNLKIRTGFGVTGNQDAISPYYSLSLMEPNGVTSVDGSKVVTYGITSNSNPDLKWETKQTFDVGLDFSAFDSRLNLTVDYYLSKTKDMLYTYSVPVPPFTYTTLLANIGNMSNNGLDLNISGQIIKTKDFDFGSGLNLSFVKNKLNSLHGTYNGQELTTSKHIALTSMNTPGLTFNTGVTYLMEGEPVGTFYLPHCSGINEKGQYILDDLNGDNTIDTGDNGDRQVCGQALPKMYLGLNLNFRYRQWDLSTQFNGAFGHKIYNAAGMVYSNMSIFPTYNVLSTAPSLNNGKGIYDVQISDYWLEKGDYLNFEYLSLGYNIPQNILEKTKYIKNLRLSVSVNNICTITGYSGLTPMINSVAFTANSTDNSIGIANQSIYPLTRTYLFTLSVKF